MKPGTDIQTTDKSRRRSKPRSRSTDNVLNYQTTIGSDTERRRGRASARWAAHGTASLTVTLDRDADLKAESRYGCAT